MRLMIHNRAWRHVMTGLAILGLAAHALAPIRPASAKGTAATAKPQAAAPASKARTGSSMKIQEVRSPGGISAWLVEEHSVPLIAMRFAFSGGSAQDPDGKAGVANFLSAMLDEGAGDLDAAAFQERMEEIAMRMTFQDGRDTLYGNMQTLTENRDAAADLLRLALSKPRFDRAASDRIRKQLLANLAFAAKNPNSVASNAWIAAAFPNHPYGRPAAGTLESVTGILPKDLEVFRKRVFAREHLKIAVVGDIDAGALGLMLDKIFGDLPAKAELKSMPAVKLTGKDRTNVIQLQVPQSVVFFGTEGLKRKDPDYIAGFVMNHILGGGGFGSRLMEEVREKRGLAYSVHSYLQHYDQAQFFAGTVATKNEKVGESLDVIRSELKRMAANGPTAEELANAKSYLTGSYALRFDTNAKIASQLLGIQNDGLGADYVATRNSMIEAVTLDDVKRVAKRVLGTNGLIVTVVGQPKNLPGGG